jgi:RNA polymerase sigma factor (TIGR02999 family)
LSDISQVLGRLEAGEAEAFAELLPLVYHDLRKLAAAKMAQERADHTLQPTALVHEAYLRLFRPHATGDSPPPPKLRSRGHFFAAAAEAMRRILIEAARHRDRLKRGGGWRRSELPEVLTLQEETDWDSLLSLDEALARLEREDPESYRLVMLRYFGGLTMGDAAQTLGISERTAHRYWNFARAWLRRELS